MNDQLVGMRCVGCGHEYPVDDYPVGCPRCQSRGSAANLYCRYDEATPYRARLPIQHATSLGEGATPLFRSGSALGFDDIDVWIKDESANPTGSHKDRFSWGAVGRAACAGYRGVVAASSGNAALSIAAYAAACGLECDIAVTAQVPETISSWVRRTGARVHVFERADQRWEYAAQFAEDVDRLTITNHAQPVVGSSPFGIDGFKPLAWELWDRWETLPAHIVLPASRGDLAFGVYLGLTELSRGYDVPCPRVHLVEPFPRLAAVRAGAGVHDTFPGSAESTPSLGGETATVQALEVLDRTAGEPVVIDSDPREAQDTLASCGLLYERSSAVVLPAALDLRERGIISAGETVVLVMTSHPFKGL